MGKANLKAVSALSSSEPVVLLVDDEPRYLASLSLLFTEDPVRLLRARSGLHALDAMKGVPVAVVVADYWMDGMDGIQLLNEVLRLYPLTGRVLLTGRPDSEIIVEAKGHKVLTKDMNPDLIRRVILREARRHA